MGNGFPFASNPLEISAREPRGDEAKDRKDIHQERARGRHLDADARQHLSHAEAIVFAVRDIDTEHGLDDGGSKGYNVERQRDTRNS